MTGQAQACADWLRKDPAFERMLRQMLEKYRKYGRTAGKITLPDASWEECEAACRVLGRPFRAPLQFRMTEFEAELQNSKFGSVDLKEVLKCYFGAEIQTARELRQERERRYAALLAEAGQAARGTLSRRWLDTLGESDLLRRAVRQDESGARHALLRACRGLDRLEQQDGQPLRLAVLSAQAVGDPHALDSGTLCGRLFLHALAFRAGQAFPGSAEERDSLCFQSGILCGSISSCVAQAGLLLEADGAEHPAYQAFRERHEPCTLTLAGVSRLSGASSPSGRVYLVENEGVFCQLCDRAARHPLVCTSGQPSVAALQLLELLAASGAELFYSGDFDGKGLSIAASLLSRWPRNVRLWHFTREDYARCRSGETLSDASRALLGGCAGTALEQTAEAVGQCGKAGYQELLLPLLEADLTEAP